MGTPDDWLREARAVGVHRLPAHPPGAAPAPAPPRRPSEDAVATAMRRRADRLAERSEERALKGLTEEEQQEREEEQEERDLRRKRNQLEIARMDQQMNALMAPPAAADNPALAILRETVSELQKDNRELMRALHARPADGDQALKSEIHSLQSRLDNLLTQTQADPIAQMTGTLRTLTEFKRASDDLMPPPPTPPPPVDHRLTRQDQLEELRVSGEMRLRQQEINAAIEEAQFARENIREERKHREHRVDRVAEMIENTVTPLVEKIGADKVVDLFDGVTGGRARAGGGAGGAAAATAPPPGPSSSPPQLAPYTCYSCHGVNEVPPGTTHHVCVHCGQHNGLEAPGASA